MRIAVLALCLAASTAFAAPPAPVHWTLKSAAVKPALGAKFTLVVHAEIEPGWHLYALQEPEGGPFATEIALAEADPADLIRVDQSKPRVVPDAVFGKPTSLFEKSADFTLQLSLPKNAKVTGPLHVLLRYQSCNDKVCLPPHTDTLEVPIR